MKVATNQGLTQPVQMTNKNEKLSQAQREQRKKDNETLKEYNKQKIEQRKRDIQEWFSAETGLKIQQVKQGMGTTTDGNTARRFFENPTITAEICGKLLIKYIFKIFEMCVNFLKSNTIKLWG